MMNEKAPTKQDHIRYYLVVATANPQDYFNGDDPMELIITLPISSEIDGSAIEKLVAGGYTVIVREAEQ